MLKSILGNGPPEPKMPDEARPTIRDLWQLVNDQAKRIDQLGKRRIFIRAILPSPLCWSRPTGHFIERFQSESATDHLSTRQIQSLLQQQWQLPFSMGAINQAQKPVSGWL